MRILSSFVSLACVLCACVAHAAERPFVPSVFADGMVLQRDASVPVWGFAEPGTQVTVRFADQTVETTADATGRWTATLSAMPASHDGRELVITSDSESANGQASRTIRDVLVGDVYLLGGQSNMAWQLNSSAGAAQAKRDANYPWLRVFHQAPGKSAADDRTDDVLDGRWTVCTPDNAGAISGVGFFFARDLHQHIDVPIALIHTAMGGTRIESWIDRKTLASVSGVEDYLKRVSQAEQQYDQQLQAFQTRLAAWETTREGRRPDFPNMLGPDRVKRPSALFNGKVAPLQPMALRGVLWYQGEGNAGDEPAYYEAAHKTLIETWRRDFNQPELPFLIVQLTSFGKGERWPGTRDAQRRVTTDVPNTGLIVTLDVGAVDDIHPTNKRTVGERAARLARSLVYGHDVVATGPMARSAHRAGDQLVVRFDHAGDGLRAAEGDVVRGFEVRDASGTFRSVEGRITQPGEVTLDAQGATAVRYAWSAVPSDANLLNAELLPAATFLIDQIEE